MRRRFYTLDVFTSTPLAGNPLAVVIDSEGLDDAAMAKIAREFNLSETVFCFPPADPVNTATLRIFTPTTELPFAGHPTVGTAVLAATLEVPELLAREDVGLVLEEKIGLVRCTVRHRRGEAAHARFEVPRLAEPSGTPPSNEEIAALFGFAPDDIGVAGHRPTSVSAGNPVTFVPLASLEALGRLRVAGDDGGGDTGERRIFYFYTPVETDPVRTYRCRMFAIGLGVPEDPATGAAGAAFPGALLLNETFSDGPHDCVLLQGFEMGRPSRIGIGFTVEGGRLTQTAIGGSAVIVSEGIFDL